MTRRISLPWAALVVFLAVGSGCGAHRSHPPIQPDLAMLHGLEAIQSRQSERGLVLTVPDALFDANRPDLKADGRRELAAVAAYLKAHADQKALIEGHTDDAGGEKERREMSLARGTSVETFLLKTGVDPEHLEVRGLGSADPVATNATRAGRRQNRRVEIVMLRPAVAGTGRGSSR